MATAVPSPLASSVEKTNGAKLNRLLIDGGTTVLRDIFDHHHLPVNLAAWLNANCPKLQKLLKKRVLHQPQWDKLFPPGGAAPDSNTFDITLLFLLLTNICGLSPPLSGWHIKPLPSDTSLEANLARIKFFRNVLYGHAPSTGVDTPTFSSLWQEISTVIVSLGFDPAEIDRLKAEHCCEEDYLNLLIDWAEREEDIKSQLKDIRQSQTKTEETVKEVHEIQREARRMQLEDHETLQHTKQAVEQMQQKHQEGHTEIQEVLKENQETLMQVKHKVENLEGRRNEDKEEVLRKLAIVDTQRVIQNHAGKYQEGTRESIFEKVKVWIEDRTSENRVMVISGNAGMGKSVIAALVCQKMHEAKRLSGSHFCQHDKARYRNPNVMLQSLASQLCDSLPEYKKVLVEKLSRNLGEDINNLEVGELFELLFEEPLSTLDDPGRNILMVIDGLDESEYRVRNELLDVIADHFCELPVWIRFCVTTRPEINIADCLKKFKPLQLEPDDDENLKDIRLFFEKQLSDVIPAGYQEVVINELARKAEGLILYAYLLVDFIKNNIQLLTPEQLDSTLPSGISSVYHSYFERLEKNLSKELTMSGEEFLTFLSALVAARQPLPLGFVSKVLLSGPNSLVDQRKVKKAVNCISALLPVQDDCIHFFHKSVKDWLIDASSYGQHDFIVNENKGHFILSQLSIDELDDVKGKGVNSTEESSDTTKYALQHGVRHMLELEESTRASSYEDVVDKYVADLELVYAKLCVNNSAASEDIVCVQKEDSFYSLSQESQRALTTLLFLLRKYHERFTTHPNVFFQTMLNEGGNLLSAKTATLLQNKYPKVSRMEYVHKETPEGSIQAKFRCSSKVACFDISPHYDYMVCECSDQTIHLWSLCTGMLLWKRPVKVAKCYLDKHQPFRVSSSSSVWSCYRSVVFHPAKDVVLPGILSDVYTFNGELKPLFPQSSCSFSVCSISGDKTKMLTDFPGGDECLILWSLKDGSEIARTIRLDEAILSFAWSPDGRLLAISHISGLVCLVDAKNSFGRLAQVTIPKACGMIKFSPGLQSLYCWHEPIRERRQGHSLGLGPNGFRLNVNESRGTFSLDVYPDNVDYDPCAYELPSKGGFLMGDPVSCLFKGFPSGFPNLFLWCLVEGTFAFVVNEQTVIRVFPGNNFIVMSSPDVVKYMRKASLARLGNIAFSLNADTVYGVTDGTDSEPTVTCISMDVSSRELKAELKMANNRHHTGLYRRICVVPVREGVVLNPSDTAVELWNFELSERVQRWPNLREVRHMMPISEERVACVGREFKVHILDTTSKNVVKSIPLRHEEYKSTYPMFYREAIVCNRKYQLLSTDRDSVQLSDGTCILWKIPWEKSLLYNYNLPGMFSPAEEFVVISAKTSEDEQDVYVLDASSGKTLRTLCRDRYFFNCVFVSNEECVIECQNIFRLFNVRSGDLLSVIDMDIMPSCLASCPQKSLIAVGLWCSHRLCAFIEVKLPRDTDRLQSKRFELHQ